MDVDVTVVVGVVTVTVDVTRMVDVVMTNSVNVVVPSEPTVEAAIDVVGQGAGGDRRRRRRTGA